MEHRSIAAGAGRIVSTALPAGSHLVRLHPRAEGGYDRMIVVTEMDGGRTLFLSGWVGPPLSPSEWRAAAASLFPDAMRVKFVRLADDGRARHVCIRLHKRTARG